MARRRRGNESTAIPAYLEALRVMTDGLKPGTVNHVEVRHDRGCDLLKHRGPCSCKPDVALLGWNWPPADGLACTTAPDPGIACRF